MIDVERETLVTISEAPRLIPAINAVPGIDARKPLHPRTVFNWASRGKRGVVLETTSIGGILVTSREALARFFSRLSSAREQRFIERDHNPQRRAVRRRNVNQTAARERLAARHGV